MNLNIASRLKLSSCREGERRKGKILSILGADLLVCEAREVLKFTRPYPDVIYIVNNRWQRDSSMELPESWANSFRESLYMQSWEFLATLAFIQLPMLRNGGHTPVSGTSKLTVLPS